VCWTPRSSTSARTMLYKKEVEEQGKKKKGKEKGKKEMR
jgi:hypothetical protein